MAENFEALSDYRLDDGVEAALIAQQTECTLVWATRDGAPLGVIMTYLARDGRFWLTASTNRGRIAAMRREPRVALVISSAGTSLGHGKSVTYRGICTVHDDAETKRWFYPALGERRFPDDDAYRAEFVRKLDSERRVILEITTTQRIGIDLVKMHRAAEMYDGGTNA
jgi:Pyridoxamine 5'-phosphate oxidase